MKQNSTAVKNIVLVHGGFVDGRDGRDSTKP
jgi:hypothetical protein